ncbi:unnamed protein product, partial [marine sediment metagenome]
MTDKEKIVYIASKFALKDKVIELYKELMKYGHIVTIIWWQWEGKQSLKDLSDNEFYNDPRIKFIKKRDLFGIDECDIFVLLSDENEYMNFNGTNFEMGYATAKGKEVYVIGKLDKSALYSGVIWCRDIPDFIVKMICRR